MIRNLCHLQRTTILPVCTAVLFTSVAYAQQAGDVGLDVGCAKFTTREPAEGEIPIDKAPFVITDPGKYIVIKDLAADASAIAIQADNVTLDLNGHTVKYGCGVKIAENIMTYTSRRSGNIGHAGILLPSRPDATADFKGFRWNSRRPGIVVKNGTIADGAGKGLSHSAGIQLAGAAGTKVQNVRIEIAAPDTFGLVVGKDAKVRHVTIINNSTHVTNRHAQMASIQTSSDCEVFKCLIEGGPQMQDDDLVELTREVAQQVKGTGRTKRLHPMNAYERRLVHLTVREFEQLGSRSEGNGHLKRVKIYRQAPPETEAPEEPQAEA